MSIQRHIEKLAAEVGTLRREVARLQRLEPVGHYKGTKAADFTTADLPQPGDYGYQTTDNEVQINCNGTVRAIATAAL
jgi:hypothetical protein